MNTLVYMIGQLKIKVSDLAAISDSQFLVAEQVVDQDKKMSHVIYKKVVVVVVVV